MHYLRPPFLKYRHHEQIIVFRFRQVGIGIRSNQHIQKGGGSVGMANDQHGAGMVAGEGGLYKRAEVEGVVCSYGQGLVLGGRLSRLHGSVEVGGEYRI